MRNKSLVLAASVLFLATTAMAQSIEYDDMYFNGKDRKKLKEKEASEQAAFSQSGPNRHNKNNSYGDVYADNSSASYSARNQNPEFTARSNSKAATEEDEYYSTSYSNSYAKASGFKQFNSSYSNWYNNPWVANNYWGSSIYGWNSPYYGSYYDSWGNPWMNPYYGSGWSSSFAFHGNPYNYGMMGGYGWSGLSFGMAYTFGNPYYNSWANWGYPGYGMGYGFGGGYYGGYYPTYVIVDNGGGRNYAYGKRGTQNGMVTRKQSVTRPSAQPNGSNGNGTIGDRPVYNGSAGGRMAATSNTSAPSRGQAQRQDDYYNRNWRTARQGDAYGGARNTYSQPSRSNQSGWNNSNWNNNNSNQNQWNRSGSFDSGRSSYGGSSGGGLSTGGGGGGSRTRVRD